MKKTNESLENGKILKTNCGHGQNSKKHTLDNIESMGEIYAVQNLSDGANFAKKCLDKQNFNAKTLTKEKKSPKKIWRICTSFAAAMLLGAMALIGTACSPSSANTNAGTGSQGVENVGLITPRANDPTILTTESGLEIKYGNATIQPSLGSGNLAGFPYFTTNDGSKDYTWVIIGINYAADNTPAGNAIISDSQNSLKKIYNYNIRFNSEIPPMSVLVFSNILLGTSIYNNTSKDPGGYYPAWYSGTNIKSAMDAIYSAGNYGLSSIKSKIQNVNLITNTYIRDVGSSFVITADSTNARIFPLAATSGSSFLYSNYLTNAQLYSSNNFWLRGCSTRNANNYTWYGRYVTTSGFAETYVSSSFYLRPAFVMSLN